MVWWSKGDFSFLSMRVCVYLKIMTPKGKQNYVRRITERAREFMESSRKKKIEREENERVGERVRELLESSGSKGKKKKMKESGSFWNQVEVKKKRRRRGCTND